MLGPVMGCVCRGRRQASGGFVAMGVRAAAEDHVGL